MSGFESTVAFDIRSRLDSSMHRHRTVLLPSLLFLLVVLLWEGLVRVLTVPTYVLPPPSAILLAFVNSYQPIGQELWVSLVTFGVAFMLTVVTGYLSALAMYEWKTVEVIFYPYVITARAIPIIALIPIFIIWFGFGFNSIVIISFLISYFAMVVNTLTGFKSTNEEWRYMLRSFSASRWDLFRHVYLYASLPSVFAGLKICVILTFTGVIVGEFLIGSQGIGYLIIEYNTYQSTDKMFAGVLAISVTQLILFGAVVLVERKILTWT